jgi:hypothetical protein
MDLSALKATPLLSWKYLENDGDLNGQTGSIRNGDSFSNGIGISDLNQEEISAPSGYGVLIPQNFISYYGFDQLTTLSNSGSGKTIAIIDFYGSPTAQSDLNFFCTAMGLPQKTIQVYAPLGATNWTSLKNNPALSADAFGWSQETSLDIQYAYAMAPSANLVLITDYQNSVADLPALVNFAVNTLSADVVSMSFTCGPDQSYFYQSGFDNIFNTRNTIFIAAAGDSGAQVNYPASSPNVLGVGGTVLLGGNNLYYSGSPGPYREVSWSGSGGGEAVASVNPVPSYQANLTVNNVALSGRGVPDVSYNSGAAAWIVWTNPYTNISYYQALAGTSAAAPQWAAIMARRCSAGLYTKSSSFANQQIYSLYNQNSSYYFNDIVDGGNGYASAKGYDLVTGVGSPKVPNLLTISNQATSSPTQTTTIVPTNSTLSIGTTIAPASIVLNPPNFGYTLTTDFTYVPDSYTAQNYNLFYWDLGDGTLTNQISGNHIYNSSGNYTVSMTAYEVVGDDYTIINTAIANTNVKVSLFNTNLNSGFANATNFQFTTDVQLSSLGINTYYWNFGDYSSSREPNPKHLYTLPNNYNVTLTVYTSSGEYFTDSNVIPVQLYLNESLYFDLIPPPTFAGHLNRYPFKINITSSSTEPHFIDLGAQFSKSYRYQEPENNWSFLRPQWRFLDLSGNQIDFIQTVDSPIAIDEVGKLNPSGNVVGVSGTAEFYFVDDLYNTDLYFNENPYSTIIATLRTSGLRSFNGSFNEDNKTPSFSNSLASVTLPHIFTFREPDYLNITQNGINPFSKLRFIGQDNPMLVNMKVNPTYYADDLIDGNGTVIANENEFIHYIPFDNTTYYNLFSSNNIPFSLSAFDLNGTPLNFTYTPDNLQFKFQDSNGFKVGGYYKGSFVNYTSTVDCEILGSGYFPVPSLSTKYVNPILWISNPNAGMLATAQYYSNPAFSAVSLGYLDKVHVNAFDVPTIQPFNVEFKNDVMAVSGIHGINAIAALPEPTYHAWVADSELNSLYRINSVGDILINVNLNSLLTLLQYTTAQLSFLIPNQLTPLSIALDSNQDVWVACFDTPYVFKFDNLGNYITTVTFDAAPIQNPDFLKSWIDQSNVKSNNLSYDSDDSYPIQPTCIETDLNNNVWVTYSNPFSGWLVNYDTYGNLLTSVRYHYSSPYEIVCDNNNNLWVSTNHITSGTDSSYLQYINTNGALLTSFGPFNSINDITIDINQNIWFTYSYHYVGSINPTNGNTVTFAISSDNYANNVPQWFDANKNADETALEGISCDLLGRIYVINSIENKIYVIDSNSKSIIDNFYINPKGIVPYISAANTATMYDYNPWSKSAQANGDWSGFRWTNKYYLSAYNNDPSYISDTTGTIYKNISGTTAPNYISFYPQNYYDLYKINENFDMSGQLKSVAFQQTLQESTNLFNFFTSIFGLSSHDDLGVKSYEKIANYTSNIMDLDTCNVDNLYDLAQSVDLNTDDFRLQYPIDIQRSMDLLSINQSRLFGSVLNDSFNFSSPSKYDNFNRGDLLDTNTYMVSAGTPVVLKAKSLNSYRLIPTGQVPLYDDKVTNLSTAGVSSYSLDELAYYLGIKNNSYDWTQLYEFYEFVPATNEVYVENTIDWNNQFTNINKDEYLLALTNQISGAYPDSYLNWNNSDGMMEFIFTYQLYKGFGLI